MSVRNTYFYLKYFKCKQLKIICIIRKAKVFVLTIDVFCCYLQKWHFNKLFTTWKCLIVPFTCCRNKESYINTSVSMTCTWSMWFCWLFAGMTDIISTLWLKFPMTAEVKLFCTSVLTTLESMPCILNSSNCAEFKSSSYTRFSTLNLVFYNVAMWAISEKRINFYLSISCMWWVAVLAPTFSTLQFLATILET